MVQDVTQAKQNMAAALVDISRWSASHRLKLNPDKAEVIWLGTQQQLAKLSPADKTLQLHDSTLTASTTVRNLGVQLDSELNFDDQARCCVKACYHRCRILQIRRHVDAYAVSYTPSSHRAWTTVIVYMLDATRLFSKDYSTYKTALRATSSTLHHDRHHYLYSTIYIGYRSRVGYATNCAA